MSEEIKCPVCGGNKLIVGADPSQRKCAYCGAVVQTEPNRRIRRRGRGHHAQAEKLFYPLSGKRRTRIAFL